MATSDQSKNTDRNGSKINNNTNRINDINVNDINDINGINDDNDFSDDNDFIDDDIKSEKNLAVIWEGEINVLRTNRMFIRFVLTQFSVIQ